MRYLLAIVFPPLAVLSCGKPLTAVLNLLLWALLIFPGIIHGILVVQSYQADKRCAR
jgi:uncharacterized membrane protein YqaE (UPF0057 family)